MTLDNQTETIETEANGREKSRPTPSTSGNPACRERLMPVPDKPGSMWRIDYQHVAHATQGANDLRLFRVVLQLAA